MQSSGEAPKQNRGILRPMFGSLDEALAVVGNPNHSRYRESRLHIGAVLERTAVVISPEDIRMAGRDGSERTTKIKPRPVVVFDLEGELGKGPKTKTVKLFQKVT